MLVYIGVLNKLMCGVCQVISKDVDHLYMSGDDEERQSIQQTSQVFAAQITQLLFKVPRVLLLLLKTNDCLRSVDLALGQVSHPSVTWFGCRFWQIYSKLASCSFAHNADDNNQYAAAPSCLAQDASQQLQKFCICRQHSSGAWHLLSQPSSHRTCLPCSQ